MASEAIRWVGLPQLLKKLDAELELGPNTRLMLEKTGGLAQSYLLGLMPSTWQRPRQVDLQATENSARISLPSFPYIFFERGSSGAAGAGRLRRRKTVKQFKAAGYRIRPRHYLRRTKGYTGKQLREQILELKRQTERVWQQ